LTSLAKSGIIPVEKQVGSEFMENTPDKIWFATKEEMESCAGECDYVFQSGPLVVEKHFIEDMDPMTEIVEIQTPYDEMKGHVMFPTIGEYIPNAVAENGIFVPLDWFFERRDELDPPPPGDEW
jgi:hypothetical protein